MASRIKPDVLQALQDWKAGKPVKTLELGHVHRMKDVPGFSPTIDASQYLHQDQERAHAYCFFIIEHAAELIGDFTHESFVVWCRDSWRNSFAAVLADLKSEDGRHGSYAKAQAGLTDEERDGAESLAWKALRFGWARAIEGHKESLYIMVQNPAVEQVT